MQNILKTSSKRSTFLHFWRFYIYSWTYIWKKLEICLKSFQSEPLCDLLSAPGGRRGRGGVQNIQILPKYSFKRSNFLVPFLSFLYFSRSILEKKLILCIKYLQYEPFFDVLGAKGGRGENMQNYSVFFQI